MNLESALVSAAVALVIGFGVPLLRLIRKRAEAVQRTREKLVTSALGFLRAAQKAIALQHPPAGVQITVEVNPVFLKWEEKREANERDLRAFADALREVQSCLKRWQWPSFRMGEPAYLLSLCDRVTSLTGPHEITGDNSAQANIAALIVEVQEYQGQWRPIAPSKRAVPKKADSSPSAGDLKTI